MPTGREGPITLKETLFLFRQALRYVAPFKFRFAVKVLLTILSLLPFLLLPWPVKILIDHVVEEVPVEGAVSSYPFFVRPFLEGLKGASPYEVLFDTVLLQVFLLLFLGAFGTSGRERDEAQAYLAGGQDTATNTENEANAGFSLAGGVLGLLDFYWTLRLTQALNHHYRSVLFEHLARLPMKTFDEERIGDALYRLLYDTPSITNVCYRLVLTPIASPLGLLLTAGVLFLSFGDHPFLLWLALAFLPLVLVVTYPFAFWLRQSGEQSRRAGAWAASTVEERMSNVLAVQSLGTQEREHKRWDQDSWASFRRYRIYLLFGLGAFVAMLVPGLILSAQALFYVMDLVIEEKISRGDFALLFTYFLQIFFYAADVGALWIRLQGSAAGLYRVFSLMALPGEKDPPGAFPLPPFLQELRFEGVHFAYSPERPVLRGVSFAAQRGQMVALMGPAGAGKTTLAYLIPRFLSPQAGRVLIDGTDIARVTLSSLRGQIAFVFQEHILWDGTVEENIRMGKPDAGSTEVRLAARMAGAEEFIQRLPQGYQTRLGRAGAKLSVGQKQRLALARALVRGAPILILDEPTSALDPEMEKKLIQTLRELASTCLVLVITHRLSLASVADQVLFLKDGEIVESGSPKELLSRPRGAYRRYLELQQPGTL